jgi:hypothetical protein
VIHARTVSMLEPDAADISIAGLVRFVSAMSERRQGRHLDLSFARQSLGIDKGSFARFDEARVLARW